MAIIPVSSMIKTLSDFYDPVKAEQVKQLQMKTAAMQEQQAMRQKLADAYNQEQTMQNQQFNLRAQPMADAVEGMMNLTGSMGLQPFMGGQMQAPEIMPQQLTPQVQFDAMDRIRQEYLRSGDVASALAIDEARRKAVGGDGSFFAPTMAKIDGIDVQISMKNGIPHLFDGEKVRPLTAEENRKARYFTVSQAGQMSDTFKGYELEHKPMLASKVTTSQEEAKMPFTEKEIKMQFDDYTARQDYAFQQRLQEHERSLPMELGREARAWLAPFKSEHFVKNYPGAVEKTSNVIEQANQIMENRRWNAANPDKPQRTEVFRDIGLTYSFIRSFEDNRVTDSEFAAVGLAKSGFKSFMDKLESLKTGKLLSLSEADLQEMKRVAAGLQRIAANKYNAERNRYLALAEKTFKGDKKYMANLFPDAGYLLRDNVDIAAMEPTDELLAGAFTVPAPKAPLATTPTIQTLYDEQEGMTDEQLFGMNIIPTKIWEGMPPEQRAEWANLGYRPQNIKREGAAPAKYDNEAAAMEAIFNEVSGGGK